MRWCRSGSRICRRSFSCTAPSAAAGRERNRTKGVTLDRLVNRWGNWISHNRVRATLLAAGAAFLLVLVVFGLPGTRSDAADRKKGAPQSIAVEAAAVSRSNIPV